MPETAPALGIDIGGGSAKIGIVSPTGEVLVSDVVTHAETESAPDLLDRYLAAGDRLRDTLGLARLCGIGIGLPGNIDFERGTTRLSNVPCLNDFPVVDHVRSRFGSRVLIENDATLAALAEHRFGVGQGSDRFLAVVLGTGIGVGFIENGRPVHTANGTMGDIGHAIVDPNGTQACRQGCHGCLESVASGLALQERYEALPGSRKGAGLFPLFEAARGGDPGCIRLIDEAARHIGAALVTWMHIFAPDRIAFAGGVSAAGEMILGPVRATVSRLAMADYAKRASVFRATLGSKAGLVGAAALCFADTLKERDET